MNAFHPDFVQSTGDRLALTKRDRSSLGAGKAASAVNAARQLRDGPAYRASKAELEAARTKNHLIRSGSKAKTPDCANSAGASITTA